jgi:hypothetical protein
MNGRRGITIVRAILPVGVLVAAATILYLKPGNNEAPKGPPAAAPALYGFMGAAGGEQSYAPGRLLVQIREGAMETTLMDVPLDKGRRVKEAKTGLKGLDDLAQNAGVTGISRPYDAPLNRSKAAGAGVDRWFMFHFADVKDLPGLADAFAALDEVQAVSLDWRAFPSAVPTDPGFADNWGHENRAQLPAYNPNGSHSHTGDGAGVVGFDADLPQAWEGPQGYGSASVVIAIIDSGVDTDHADLRLVTGYDFGDDDADPDDNAAGAGHGTACAGVAAALNNGIGAVGVAPGCSIMPLKVAESDGYMYFSAVQNALYYAADHGAHIVSMSFGAPLKTDAATEAALQYADAAGVVLLAGHRQRQQGRHPVPGREPVRDRRWRRFAGWRPQAQFEPVAGTERGRLGRSARSHLRRRALVGVQLRRRGQGRGRRRRPARADHPAHLRHHGQRRVQRGRRRAVLQRDQLRHAVRGRRGGADPVGVPGLHACRGTRAAGQFRP